MSTQFSGTNPEKTNQLIQAVVAIQAKMTILAWAVGLGMPLVIALVMFAINATMNMERSIGKLEGTVAAATAPIKQMSDDAQKAIVTLKDASTAIDTASSELTRTTKDLKEIAATIRPTIERSEEFSGVVQLAAATTERNDQGFMGRFPIPDVLRGRPIREIRLRFRGLPPTLANANLILNARPEGDRYVVQLFAPKEMLQSVADALTKQPLQVDVVFLIAL